MKQTKTGKVLQPLQMSGMTSKDASIVVLEMEFEGGELITSSGTAKRSAGDKYSPGVGEMLAMSRALDSMARKLKKHIQGYM